MTGQRYSSPARRVAAALAICFLVGGLAERGHAQNIEWTRQLGTSDRDDARSVAADALGNVYITGTTWGSLGGPHAGGRDDAFVAKYDATGALQWTRQLGTNDIDEGRGVSTDGLGNVYVAGVTYGSLSGVSSGVGGDVFLVKYDAAGTLQWTRQFGVPNNDIVGWDVSADGLGNIYVTGEFRIIEHNSDAFVAKYDAAGALQWTRQLSTSSNFSTGNGVSADGLGNVYITGFASGDLGGPNAGEGNAFVAKYDGAGDLQWTRQFGDSDFTYSVDSFGVSADALGNVFVTGRTTGDLGGPFQGGSSDAFVMKYDATGDRQWTRQLGTSSGDESRGIAVDGLGNVYVSGSTAGDLSEPLMGGSDAFVAKYDSAGDLLWIQQLGTPTGHATSHGVAADGLGNVYFSGATSGSLGGPLAGGVDAFVVKIVDHPPGDFDGNGVTDGADFLAWQRGESPNPLSASDLAAWQANFGAGALTSALRLPPLNIAVPEPASFVLAAGSLALIARRRRAGVRPDEGRNPYFIVDGAAACCGGAAAGTCVEIGGAAVELASSSSTTASVMSTPEV